MSQVAPRRRPAERIVEAAGDLFHRRGLRSVSVDEIVARAGVTKPTLYRHFVSKAELAAEYARRLVAMDRAIVTLIVAGLPDDPLAQLRAIVAEFAERLASLDGWGRALTCLAVELGESEHPARSVVQAWRAELRERLTDIGRRAGLGQPDRLTDGLLLLLEGGSVLRLAAPPNGPAAALADVADELIAAHRRGW